MPVFEDGAVEAYRRVITQKLPELLETIDVFKIVEKRIKNMGTMEMERMVLDVCNSELKAIEWFGAFLGAIMGVVNIFFLSAFSSFSHSVANRTNELLVLSALFCVKSYHQQLPPRAIVYKMTMALVLC